MDRAWASMARTAPLLGLVLFITFFAGCTAAGTTYHQQGIQCEPMPWDAEAYGGSEEEQLQRMRDHYSALGVNITDARIVPGNPVIAVCGAPRGEYFEIMVDGPFPMADDDGWVHGSAPEPSDG